MKDIKSYVIGFLTCACLFLIMGHSDSYGNAEFDTITVKHIIIDDGDNDYNDISMTEDLILLKVE